MRLILSLFCFVQSLSIFAAIPPLSDQDRDRQANEILQGKVLSITQKEVKKNPQWSDFWYEVELEVTKSIKGRFHKGQIIKFSYDRKNKRPPFWVGPVGQNNTIKLTTMIEIYLSNEASGRSVLLKPNGFDELIHP